MTSWIKPFLAELTATCNVSKACAAGGVTRGLVYAMRREDPVFAQQWADALEEGYDALEEEARRRAFVGTQEPVYHQGQVAGHITKYSDRLAEFLLKGYRRNTFGEKLELTGKDGGPVAIDSTTRSARVAQLMALAEQRKKFGDLA